MNWLLELKNSINISCESTHSIGDLDLSDKSER